MAEEEKPIAKSMFATIPTPAMSIFGNERNAELVSKIPIVKVASTSTKRVLFNNYLWAIKAGSIIHVTAEYQVTTPYQYNVMVGSQLIVAPAWNSTSGLVAINEANAMNFNGAVHHFRDTRVGWWVTQQDYAELFINLVVYAAASQSLTGHNLNVDMGYGRLTSVVWR